MTLRDWTDPRDGRRWKVRQTGLPPVLVFASGDNVFSVVVDFNGTWKGEPVKGGEGKNVSVDLGEGRMLADFEKALVGVKADGELSFKVKFPKDYHEESLASKKIDFTAKVHRVEEEELAPLDDTLAAL